MVDKLLVDQLLVDQQLVEQQLVDQQLVDQQLVDQQLVDQQLVDQLLVLLVSAGCWFWAAAIPALRYSGTPALSFFDSGTPGNQKPAT